MSYLGKSPTTGTRNRYYFTALGSETSLSGGDDNSKTLRFTDGSVVDVYLNGVLLVAGTDYNTTTANTISSLAALTAGDIVEILVFETFSVPDTVAASTGGTFSGGITANNFVNTGVFFENAQTVTADHTVVASKNAMSAGPVTIDSGVTVTIETGGRWVVV